MTHLFATLVLEHIDFVHSVPPCCQVFTDLWQIL